MLYVLLPSSSENVDCWKQAEVEKRMIVGKESMKKMNQQLEGNTV
jgi:hypothetical protein